ncbi:hypothetical protein, partial [uncultured Rubinisphaera sp.]|uniref:hypothetical protein n=1 Tax=uncultured Rubinisphaera sp. TaxID=1678686 RepID=UPI0030DB42C1
SSLKSRCPLSLSNNGLYGELQSDLKHLKESGVIDVRTLEDVKSFTLMLDGKEASIEVIPTKEGAVRFQLNDSGWEDEDLNNLKIEFETVYGIPVNRRIDPQALSLGGIRIVSFLLGCHYEISVEDYQKKLLDELVSDGILRKDTTAHKICGNNLCQNKLPVLDGKQESCPTCDNVLIEKSIVEINRNVTGTAKYIKNLLKNLVDWNLSPIRKFEATEYYSLAPNSGSSTEEVWVLIRDRLPETTRVLLQRSGRPLLVISPETDLRNIYIDSSGIGNCSISYLFTALRDQAEKKECKKQLSELLSALLTNHQERLLTAARHSYQHVKSGTHGDKGHEYETDIFNLLRTIFKYTVKLGRVGNVEPDGFLSIPVFGDNGSRTLDDVKSWNLTFDVKHSDKPNGYDLGMSEKRKIIDYIDSVRRKKRFVGSDRRLRAHAIISNNLKKSEIASASEYVFGSDGVRNSNKDVKLILIMEEFILKIYEDISKKKDEWDRRAPLWGECITDLINSEDASNHLVWDIDTANSLLSDYFELPAVENAMTEKEIIKALEVK